MGFADKYFKRYGYAGVEIESPVSENIGISVVIPCYNEPELPATIASIINCSRPECDVEIIVVVNSPYNAPYKALEQNLSSIAYLNGINTPEWLKIYAIELPELPRKLSGVGSARKAGMDEATRRFNTINNSEAIIVSLDADCTVGSAYLTSLFQLFNSSNISGCSIGFAHDMNGYSVDIRDAITQYELYLRYYLQAIRFTGFPNYYHTIGSAFAVRVVDYVKQGGMNRKQAGEDFYFIQKLINAGRYTELSKILVYPSARPSDRVPFGTGPVVANLIENGNVLNVFSLEPFIILKQFFKDIKHPDFSVNSVENSMLKDFLNSEKASFKIDEIRRNTSDINSFVSRFFRWFDALLILKFLNYAHNNGYQKMSINAVAKELILVSDFTEKIASDSDRLLTIYRESELTDI
jgi:glycosyltransferase involved in cell wall biosynthesis